MIDLAWSHSLYVPSFTALRPCQQGGQNTEYCGKVQNTKYT